MKGIIVKLILIIIIFGVFPFDNIAAHGGEVDLSPYFYVGEEDEAYRETDEAFGIIQYEEQGFFEGFVDFFSQHIAMPMSITWEATLWRVVIATILGFFIAFINFITYTGSKFERSTMHSQIMITIVASIIINVIGDSIAWALGLFGALSFIRFRTTLRDTKDTALFFYSVATGIACGLGYFAIAAIGVLIVTPVMFLLRYIPYFNFHYIEVNFRCSNLEETKNALEAFFVSKNLKARLIELSMSKRKEGEPSEYRLSYKIFASLNVTLLLIEEAAQTYPNLIERYDAEKD